MTGWSLTDDGSRARHARRPGDAFDASAAAAWRAPAAGRRPADYRAAMARQIRQDLWRALRRLPGFSPVVEVATAPDALGARVEVRAGGALARPVGRERVEAAAAALLASVPHRRRWHAHALARAGAGRADPAAEADPAAASDPTAADPARAEAPRP